MTKADSTSERSEEAGAATESDLAEQVSDDLDELGTTKRERDEYLELAQRTRADFDNYRKRVAKETADALARGKGELAGELVPVLDNLDRALTAAADEPGSDSLRKGVTLVRDELREILQRAGVEAYDPAGEAFDPSWHEAISTKAVEGTGAGTVLETLDRGYRLDGQVLRPARVVVSE
jgi:molecular chaperone GrpE